MSHCILLHTGTVYWWPIFVKLCSSFWKYSPFIDLNSLYNCTVYRTYHTPPPPPLPQREPLSQHHHWDIFYAPLDVSLKQKDDLRLSFLQKPLRVGQKICPALRIKTAYRKKLSAGKLKINYFNTKKSALFAYIEGSVDKTTYKCYIRRAGHTGQLFLNACTLLQFRFDAKGLKCFGLPRHRSPQTRCQVDVLSRC